MKDFKMKINDICSIIRLPEAKMPPTNVGKRVKVLQLFKKGETIIDPITGREVFLYEDCALVRGVDNTLDCFTNNQVSLIVNERVFKCRALELC